MREIKFRVWDKQIKRWLEDFTIGLDGDVYLRSAPDEVPMFMSSGRVEVMQFTGFFDMNGKEIYEGDILGYKYEWSDSGEEMEKGVVNFGKWNCSCCNGVYGFYGDGIDLRRCEEDGGEDEGVVVIGNIYENPELLGDIS